MKRFLIREDALARIHEILDRLERLHKNYLIAEDAAKGKNSRDLGRSFDLSLAKGDLILSASEVPALIKTELARIREIPRKKKRKRAKRSKSRK